MQHSTNSGFTTMEGPATAETVIKKSRFISSVTPILTVDEAEKALNTVRLQHKSANHHCYAYSIGIDVPVERYSDDGEPSGTAGRPILEVVRRTPVSNVLIVVTRYFGGTLLGTNGLVRAYADGASKALAAATMLQCKLMQRVNVTCDYSYFGKIEYELGQTGYTLLNKEFAEVVRFQLFVAPEQASDLSTGLGDWSAGQAVVTLDAAEYIGQRPNGEFVEGVWPSGK